MEENRAYDRMLEVIRQAGGGAGRDGALRIRIGTVLTVAPLRIDVAGTTQEAARFFVCGRLLSGRVDKGSPSGSLSVSASCALGGSHSAMDVSGGTVTFTVSEAAYRAGDAVLLLTEDDQSFYLIDKVVAQT